MGDLHKVFSGQDVAAETQKGCRAASIRCEACKREAARSVCAVIAPIHARRLELESRIDETWEMLRAQSAKASVRAEQTLIQVREVFDLSRELGTVRRHFVATGDDLLKAHDLSAHADWWELAREERSKLLREYWRESLLPREVQLGQESNRIFTSLERELEEPFISAKKKRVLVTAAREADGAEEWEFEIPAKTYEVWTLLCWRKNYWLEDFVIPQKFYAQPFAQAKKLAKDQPIRLRVRKLGEGWKMEFVDLAARAGAGAGIAPMEITELRGNHAPLN